MRKEKRKSDSKKGRRKSTKQQEKTTTKLSQKVIVDAIGETKYSFVPVKICPVSNGSVKKGRAGPLTLSRRMSSKLAKSTNALESPFFVCRLNFSPTKFSQRRQVVIRSLTKNPRKTKRKAFGKKGRKLPTQG